MGWLWSSSTPSAESPTSADPSSIPSQEPQPPPSTLQPSGAPPATPTRSPTRDELAEAELRSLLEELEADVRPSSTKYNRVPQPPPLHSRLPQPSNLTVEESLLPTEMSCRQAFDAAFYCQSLGGQFNNLYRYGSIRSCSENWRDFWFCMRSKNYPPEQKESMIRNHYKRKALKYKVGPSSEDIWESRDKKLAWGEAFSEPTEEPAGSDEEWNRRERLRREGKMEGTT